MKSQSDFNGIPASTWQFIAEHHPVVSVCAFQFGFYKGEEIYGIDMCVELCSELKKQYPQIGFVCAVAEVGDATYFKEIQKRIKQKNIENNFHFVLEPCEFYPLLPKSDLFVRPTCTDAYGVSVAEAIHFGVPAVASDVCERSRGAILFEARNQGDFLKKVREVLANPRVYRERLNQVLQEDTFEKLLELYNQLGLEVS
jgi:glycosyltransferase involved in cell wall biosynthesis